MFGVPLALVLALLLTWAGLFGELPSTEEIANPKSFLATEILSADGKQIGTFFMENRVHADYSELPPHLVNALIATEDERYHDHAGIDFRSLGRAVATLGTGGGGSTITQQLAKQMFHGEGSSNIFARVIQKLKEWVISLQLESNYSKEEIIAMYFNQFDFLYQGVGIHNAANVYFGKLPSELNVEEAAMLVGMFKNPWSYNPAKSDRQEAALARRNTVLRQMERNDFLTEEEADSLVALPLVLSFQRQGHDQGLAPYLREYIRSYMKDWIAEHPKPDGGTYNLYTDGLKIYTTIDSRMQRMAEEAVERHLTNLQGLFFKQISKRKAVPSTQEATVCGGPENHRPCDASNARYRHYWDSGWSDEHIVKGIQDALRHEIFAWGGSRHRPEPVGLHPILQEHLPSRFAQRGTPDGLRQGLGGRH